MNYVSRESKKYIFFENFFSLSVLQFASNALPMITIPFLTRALGLEVFGKYVFILALINFLDIVVSYGFRVSATDQIAKNTDNYIFISELFWTVIVAKALLFLGVLALVAIGIAVVPASAGDFGLLWLGMPLLFGNLLFPVWLFQGLQNMKFITILHLISKVFFVIGIFVFVDDSSDIGIAIFLHAMGFCIAGILSIIVALKFFTLTFHAPTFRGVLNQLGGGRDIFFSQLMVSFYSTINVIVLGMVQPGAVVASYALGEKVFRLVGSLSSPFNRAIFPMLSSEYAEDRAAYFKNMRRATIVLFAVFLFLGVLIHILAPQILIVLTGMEVPSEESILTLKILSLAIPFFVLAAFSTYHLVTQGKSSSLLKIIMMAAGFNLMCIYPVSIFYQSAGVACLTLFVSIALAVSQVSKSLDRRGI
jgi:polysaccharide transporter, PST family